MKKEVTITLGILLVLTSMTFVSSYKLLCLGYGEQYPGPSGKTCWSDICQVCVNDAMTYHVNPQYCKQITACELLNGTAVDADPPSLTINSPVQDEVYDSRSVLFDVESDEPCSLYYIDNINGRGRWKRVCSKCRDYSRNRRFDEGLNNITIKCEDVHGNAAEAQKQFRVDSKEPRIRSMTDEEFASGFFKIEHDEQNPVEIWGNYGNTGTGWRAAKFNLQDCYEERNDIVCGIDINLGDYDEQEIQFWFNITDIAGNSDKTKVQEAKVDNTPPVINDLQIEKNKRRVTFMLDIAEKNFDEVTYAYMDDRGRIRTGSLCRRINFGICEDSINFKDGFNNVTVIVKDQAGNQAQESVSFYIDSKGPKITSTKPRRGFASGTFSVEFIEENPVLLVLHYGNLSDMKTRSLNLGNCQYDRNKQKCETDVNLGAYHGQEIEYYFTIEDFAGNTEESKHTELEVDTAFPVLNNLGDFWSKGQGRYVEYIYFNLSITEENLDEVEYYDNSDSRPKWRRLCSRLEDERCVEKERFDEGHHSVDVQITDEAGNSIAERIEFSIP